jgi:autotransporter-associated beta strand protein
VTDHGTLVFNRTDSYGGVVSNTISGTGTVTLASGLLTLSGTNTYTGVTTLSGGFMTVSNNLGMSTNRVVLAGGGISVPGEALTLTNAVTVSSASSLNAVGNLTLLGALTNSGALTKTGAGTLTLVASSPYSGLLTVSNGTLTLNGSIAGSVTIAAGGTLNGTGAVAGAVSNYGTISPADATTNGTLTVSNMVMGANSTYVWNCNNTTNDVIVVNGSLTLPNVATVTVNQATGRLPNPGVLFTGFSSVNTSNLTGWVVSGAMGNTRAKVDGNQVVLVSPRGCVLYVE